MPKQVTIGLSLSGPNTDLVDSLTQGIQEAIQAVPDFTTEQVMSCLQAHESEMGSLRCTLLGLGGLMIGLLMGLTQYDGGSLSIDVTPKGGPTNGSPND